jgi:hypothetical protein
MPHRTNYAQVNQFYLPKLDAMNPLAIGTKKWTQPRSADGRSVAGGYLVFLAISGRQLRTAWRLGPEKNPATAISAVPQRYDFTGNLPPSPEFWSK